MLRRADSVGVLQVESQAQTNMLPQLRPEKFYDRVVEVAIVSPGPNAGDMVHPYLRRKAGKKPVTFPSPPRSMGMLTSGVGARQDLGRASIPGTGDAGGHRGR